MDSCLAWGDSGFQLSAFSFQLSAFSGQQSAALGPSDHFRDSNSSTHCDGESLHGR
jgi:hypothetical protein